MSKLSIGARKRQVNEEPQPRQQWRASVDAPINLTKRSAMDSATGQKALVLAFAAVAVAGAAYFATVMIAPADDPASVVSQANARPKAEVEPVTATPEQEPPAAPTSLAAATAPDAAETPPVAEQAAVFPAPVRVKTVTVPTAAPVAQPAKPEAAPAAIAQDGVVPENETIASSDPTEPPVEETAYTSADPIVSEGIEAVMNIAAKEQPAADPTGGRKKKTQDAEVKVAAVPEMAGGGAARQVRSAVTMRSNGAKGASAIGVIPANASVTVAPGCKSWCQVTYNGKRGYIYKGFLR